MDLEPIDHKGKSIGCIARMGDTLIAITPNGQSRQCGDRASAIWWLQETAAGRDPERADHRFDKLLLTLSGMSLLIFVVMFFQK